jgi:cysteine-rich repeat protein
MKRRFFINAVIAAFAVLQVQARAQELGTANSFAVLGGSTVTNTGSSIISGNLGVSPGFAITGFPPGTVVPPGTIHAADAVAGQAQEDLTIAYDDLAGMACNFDLTGQDLGGMLLTPGVYCFSSSAGLTGTLTLDAEGVGDALFVFQIGSTITTASNSAVLLINGGQACNVFWQVGSSATLGTDTAFVGNILALTSITLTTGADVSGRALARNGAVTMDTNHVSIGRCVPCVPGTDCPPGEDIRPCCLPNGSCVEKDKAECLAEGGANGGPGLTCSVFVCGCPDEQDGCPVACCLPEGGCQDWASFRCIEEGGTPQAVGATCTDPCLVCPCVLPAAECERYRKCTLPDGSCVNVPKTRCMEMLGGVPGRKRSTCRTLLPCGTFCGDGEVTKGEECDDGNNVNGDGCSAECNLETVVGSELCLIIIDEDGIDNDMRSVERAAASHGVRPDFLVNDDRPTKMGNPPLRWNQLFPGDIALLPTGQVDDEGWFALPPVIRYADDRTSNLTNQQWIAAFVNGTLPQDLLDKVRDVMPLRNHELVELVGRTCVAVVYDSDISINYRPEYANLQGERYGLFTFTVLGTVLDQLPVVSSPGIELPGTLPESGSSTSLFDLWVRVESPMRPTALFDVIVRDHEPDSISITSARYTSSNQTVKVFGVSNFAPGAIMTVSIDDFILEAPMTYVASRNRYEYTAVTPTNLRGRRVTISTNEGGAYNRRID